MDEYSLLFGRVEYILHFWYDRPSNKKELITCLGISQSYQYINVTVFTIQKQESHATNTAPGIQDIFVCE